MTATEAGLEPLVVTTPLIRKSSVGHADRVRQRILLTGLGVSVLLNSCLLGILILADISGVLPFRGAKAGPPTETAEASVLPQPPQDPASNDLLTITDIDPAALEPNQMINFPQERLADVSVPGIVNPTEPIGIEHGDMQAPPMNLHAPGGLPTIGQGGALELPNVEGSSNLPGMAGGYSIKGVALPGSFYGRSGATRERALISGGGTGETEACVAKGLVWLSAVQSRDGAWRMDGPFANKGRPNDIAGTAFGLLPFLGAGKTHKPDKDNPYNKNVERALGYLLRKQDRRTGNFGNGMYAHSLATIAMCEAYGLSQDPILRQPAQMAINYLVAAQHVGGGWRYTPGQEGDLSVSGWVIMALKSAKMAGLDVPELTFRKAIRFLDSVCNRNTEGYGYNSPETSPTMTSVGLLCRQYLQAWGPNNLRLIKGIENHLKPNPPGKMRDMYYYYYATQVMHHFGGQDWKQWNKMIQADLVKRQDADGSFNPNGDRHAAVGGRMMETSLCILTLEVYYRYLPLYYRDAVAAK